MKTQTGKHRTSPTTRPSEISKLIPRVPCHKCGQTHWVSNVEPLTWHCVYCGNLVYYMYGMLQQQIDMAMASGRKNDFVPGPNKNTLIPRKDEEIKRIRFAAGRG